jgi:signal transduction histidine kinase
MTQEPNSASPDLQRRLGDLSMALDLLGTLPGARDERTVVAAVHSLFTLLCAPSHVVYVPVADGQPGAAHCCPEGWKHNDALRTFLAESDRLHARSESGNGFLVRLGQAGETLAVLEIEGIAFPQYKSHYLNLALSIANVCGLAVQNARTHDRLLATIAERERAEAEIGHLNTQLMLHVREVELANQELESFSYSVSHDLRAPLRIIDAFSKALLEDCAERLSDEGKKHLSYVHEAAQRMGRLIDDLLGLSRVTRCGLHIERVDLTSLSKAVAARLQHHAPAKRQVEFVVEEALAADGDARLLEIALENLLGNAWKFTGKKQAARIEFGRAAQDGVPHFFVRDDGAGFDMTYAARLFVPFQRLHSPSEFEGTGIGLATVQRIIRRHGGRIWAEGRVDQGATFSFTLSETECSK